jgi:hypothetical protein
MASYEGNVEMAKYLIEEQLVSVDVEDEEGQTPIFWSVARGQVNERMPLYLLRAGADPFELNNYLKCPYKCTRCDTVSQKKKEYADMCLNCKTDFLCQEHGISAFKCQASQCLFLRRVQEAQTKGDPFGNLGNAARSFLEQHTEEEVAELGAMRPESIELALRWANWITEPLKHDRPAPLPEPQLANTKLCTECYLPQSPCENCKDEDKGNDVWRPYPPWYRQKQKKDNPNPVVEVVGGWKKFDPHKHLMPSFASAFSVSISSAPNFCQEALNTKTKHVQTQFGRIKYQFDFSGVDGRVEPSDGRVEGSGDSGRVDVRGVEVRGVEVSGVDGKVKKKIYSSVPRERKTKISLAYFVATQSR